MKKVSVAEGIRLIRARMEQNSSKEVRKMGKFYFESDFDNEISENPAENPSPSSILSDMDKGHAPYSDLDFVNRVLIQDAAKVLYVRKVAYRWCLATGEIDRAASINKRRRVPYGLVAQLIATWFPDGADDKEVWLLVKALVNDCTDCVDEVSMRTRCWFVKRLLN